MKNCSIALLIYGEPGSTKNALTEAKYKKLADHFIEKGFTVDSVLYHDSVYTKLETQLQKYDAILVWVNPIEQGNSRQLLDQMLTRLAEVCFVSAHPDTILRIGTKEVLYKIKDTEFGGDIKRYDTFGDFKNRFLDQPPGIRILKQYRGNGGNGVFRVDTLNKKQDKVIITHATKGDQEIQMTVQQFYSSFETYFDLGSILIDQQWNPNIVNGMVRCYLSGTKVSGFGYQEVNALYPVVNGVYKKPGQRFYYSDECALFADLKNIMEKKWVPQLQELTGIRTEKLPVIWDADFFINKLNTDRTNEKYSLCEINASCVSPFPESSIPHIFNEVKKRILI
ncbi:MAG TPA: Cj0069 family protein [Chitinophagaceae bacterium]|nr:Cj0069 family protein [Chitinophagaceae bacterium]